MTIEEKEEELEKTMSCNHYDNCADTEIERQRSHFEYRLKDVYHEKVMKAMREFGLTPDSRPTTSKELVERILAGKYILPKDTNANGAPMEFWGHPADNIRWADPEIKRDDEGYGAFKRKLDEDLTSCTDRMVIADAENLLRLFEEFKALPIK